MSWNWILNATAYFRGCLSLFCVFLIFPQPCVLLYTGYSHNESGILLASWGPYCHWQYNPCSSSSFVDRGAFLIHNNLWGVQPGQLFFKIFVISIANIRDTLLPFCKLHIHQALLMFLFNFHIAHYLLSWYFCSSCWSILYKVSSAIKLEFLCDLYKTSSLNCF